MIIKAKTVVMAVSLFFNVIFIAFLALTALSRSATAFLSYPSPDEGYTAAATVAIFPSSSALVWTPVEIDLKPSQKILLQYSVIADKKQNNVLINALFDPDIITVEHSAPGIIITALREGETLMQFITNDGIKDLALITVSR